MSELKPNNFPPATPAGNSDQAYMARALQLAAKGLYSTSPNPRVGCVIVKDGEVVGEGWHQKAGEPHAEVHALGMAGHRAQGATAYVTLEPCSHFGRTPPCAEALIKAGVRKVVGACQDPNPSVAGRGYQMLRDAGIDVLESCLAEQAEALNVGFMKRMRTGLPYVRVKIAQSLDGRTAMASGESQWITGPQARRDVQRLRARSCAVLTGADSVLIDDPSMTVRPAETGIDQAEHLWRQPLRVLVDGRLRVSPEAALFQLDGPILIASCADAFADPASRPDASDSAQQTLLERAARYGENVQLWCSPTPHTASSAMKPDRNGKPAVDLQALLKHLGQIGINELLVETGAQLAGAFVQADLVDEMILYAAPTLMGSSARPTLALPLEQMNQQIRWQWQDIRQVGGDLRLTLVRDPQTYGRINTQPSTTQPSTTQQGQH